MQFSRDVDCDFRRSLRLSAAAAAALTAAADESQHVHEQEAGDSAGVHCARHLEPAELQHARHRLVTEVARLVLVRLWPTWEHKPAMSWPSWS